MKTSDLTGPALDWAVATALGMSWWTRSNADWSGDYTDWILDAEQLKKFMFDGSASRAGHWAVHEVFTPTTDWAQGGPIIEREKIELRHDGRSAWCAWIEHVGATHGPTPLIAAMRCFVASKLGDEVDVPAELL